jgi:hypothetical protein
MTPDPHFFLPTKYHITRRDPYYFCLTPIILLIAALTHLALWLLGLATIQARHHYQYQANTTRHRLVLSAITLGRHVIQRGRDRLPASVLWAALRHSQVTLCAPTTP